MPVGGSLPRAGFNKMRGITTAHVQYKHHAWLNLYLKSLSLISSSVTSVVNSVLIFCTTEYTEALRATQRRQNK